MSASMTKVSKTKKQPALRFKTGSEVKEHCEKLSLNPSEFWSRISVT